MFRDPDSHFHRYSSLSDDDTVVYAQINQPAGGQPVPVEITANRQPDGGYKRPKMSSQHFVPDVY